VCYSPAGRAVEEEQKQALRAVLSEIISNHRIDCIAEEAHPVRPSLGTALARRHRSDYVDITMPLEERERQGIRTPGYDRHPATRAEAYRKFEQYMFNRIEEAGAKSVLVMCGRYHTTGLEKIFKDAGDDVQMYDIKNYDWYRGVPIEGPDGIEGYDNDD